MEDFYSMMKDANDYHQRLDAEYNRLRQDVPLNVKVGDTVLVAAGLIGRGHPWIRKKALVLKIANSSIFIRGFNEYEPKEWEEWVDPALITDILSEK